MTDTKFFGFFMRIVEKAKSGIYEYTIIFAGFSNLDMKTIIKSNDTKLSRPSAYNESSPVCGTSCLAELIYLINKIFYAGSAPNL